VDVDTANEAELDRLPGIGPALAARIVADRMNAGPFGSVEALQRVKGIGPALASRLAPHVTFSGVHP
jgi:competence protein ComEA